MNAYSEDLRKKIIEALRRGATKSEAARAFGVSRSSVKRYAKLVEEGRHLAPRKRPGSRPKMDESEPCYVYRLPTDAVIPALDRLRSGEFHGLPRRTR